MIAEAQLVVGTSLPTKVGICIDQFAGRRKNQKEAGSLMCSEIRCTDIPPQEHRWMGSAAGTTAQQDTAALPVNTVTIILQVRHTNRVAAETGRKLQEFMEIEHLQVAIVTILGSPMPFPAW